MAVVSVIYLTFSDVPESQGTATVCFGDACLDCEIADDPLEQSTGLMNRDYLPDDECMLFVFSQQGYYYFWMKNVAFPLDLIWITREGYVTHIQSAGPCLEDPCEAYKPSGPALYVVEANLGFALESDVVEGSQVEIEWGE